MLTILLGVSGSISAYKVPELIRQLKKQGYRVIPVVTQCATQFVSPLVLETVSEEKVWTNNDLMTAQSPHLMLSRQADVMLLAPCSANTLSKCAHGIADSLLTNCFLSFEKSVYIAPAMHTEMWKHPSTQENKRKLHAQKVRFIGPGYGDLACGDIGEGRLVQLNCIVDAMTLYRESLAKNQYLDLSGRSILITAGGTSESIDPVRMITNRSTGQLGRQLALYAALLGAKVTLITTKPFEIDLPNLTIIQVQTVESLSKEVHSNFPSFDQLYMTAAVSDFTVASSKTKIRRKDLLNLSLIPTPDILQSLVESRRKDQLLVGFCLADRDSLAEVAIEKLYQKNLDMIVANSDEVFGKRERYIHIYKNKKDPLVFKGKLMVSTLCYKLLMESNLIKEKVG